MFKLNLDMTDTPVVTVQTTKGRGFTPDEVAERCVTKLISVADTAHPAIRDQAKAYKMHMEKVVAFYMREAIRSDRTTVYNALVDAGHPDLAEAIRRL
jgi:deoxyxylulose-5-phosphate synthase